MSTSWQPSEKAPACIYLATNIESGSFYVGYTTKSLAKRRYRHLQDALVRRRETRMAASIRKHGINAFHFEVICECFSHQDALDLEKLLIQDLHPPLNITDGGLGAAGYKHGPEAIAKMKAWHAAHPEHLAKYRSQKRPGVGLKAAQTMRERGTFARYWLGRPQPREVIEKAKATRRANGPPAMTEKNLKACRENVKKASAAHRCPVLCLTNGERYASAASAAAALKLNPRTVASVANPSRPQKSIFGFRFEYTARAQ